MGELGEDISHFNVEDEKVMAAVLDCLRDALTLGNDYSPEPVVWRLNGIPKEQWDAMPEAAKLMETEALRQRGSDFLRP